MSIVCSKDETRDNDYLQSDQTARDVGTMTGRELFELDANRPR